MFPYLEPFGARIDTLISDLPTDESELVFDSLYAAKKEIAFESTQNRFYEISGNSQGPTVLFLHGGPGGGTTPRARRFFNPDFYRIVLMDQRGCGQSVPNASEKLELSLRNNTTSALIGDIESLRKIIDVDHWQLIVGGSWGSTLTVAYAEYYPERCRQLLLRGVFTAMPDEVDALFQDGTTGNHYPEEWERYVQYIKTTSENWDIEKLNLLAAYRARLLNPEHRLQAQDHSLVMN